jgi:hypothetical protein
MVRIWLGWCKFLIEQENSRKEDGPGVAPMKLEATAREGKGLFGMPDQKKGPKKVTGRVGEEPGQSGERRKWYMNLLKGGMWVP